jgi:DNA polymerase III alpha subunit (gram-positive type)
VEKYLAHDAETGGLNPRYHSLLTHYFGVYTYTHGKFHLQKELDLKIKPNPGEQYVYTEEALKINKIDLKKHDEVAITRDEAALALYRMLDQESDGGRSKLVRIGHNEPFDSNYVVNNLLIDSVWRRFTDYHTLDTVPIAKALKMKGKIPKDVKLNLGKLAEYLGVTVSQGDLHTARGDTHLCVAVLEVLLSL